MPSSTLKLYIDIAKTLMNQDLTAQDLSSFLKVNSSSLKELMSFLIDERLIREKESNSTVTYTLTKRGTRILEFFNVPPLIKLRNDRN
jgi:predicted transcriptional regulator